MGGWVASYWSGYVRIAGGAAASRLCPWWQYRALFSISNRPNSTGAGLCLSWPNLSEASLPLLRHRNYSKLPLHLKNKRQMTVDKKVIHTKAVPSRGKYNCGEAAVCRAGLFCSRPAFAPGIYFQQMAHDISQAVFPQIQMSFSQHSIIVSFSYSPTRILLYHCTAKWGCLETLVRSAIRWLLRELYELDEFCELLFVSLHNALWRKPLRNLEYRAYTAELISLNIHL